VALSGFTATFVFIYDQAGTAHQVGTTNGSYLLPPGYSISITYSVVGTWIWTDPLMVGQNYQFGAYSAENLVLINQIAQLPLTAHGEAGQAGLGSVVSN
jgi:hypothetical protein